MPCAGSGPARLVVTHRGRDSPARLCSFRFRAAPALLAFAAEAGAFAALGGQHAGVAGVGTPAQGALQPAGQRGMARVVRAAHDKGAYRTELRLDRIGPGCVRGREAQLDVLAPGTGRPRPAKYPASLRKLQWVNGWTGFSGRVLAAVTMTSISPSLIRRGRPPARRGSSAARPLALNVWIMSRTVSSPAAASRAIAGTGVPDADAMMIIARRTRTDSCLPRRTICSSRCPS